MSDKKNKIPLTSPSAQPQGGRGGMGGGGRGMMRTGAKPKNFAKTLKRLLKYMRSSLPAMIIAFAFAIASVILTLNIPNILGEATDKLYGSVIQKSVYAEIEEGLDELPTYSSMAELAADFPTFGEFLAVIEGFSPEVAAEINQKIPEKYLDGILSMSLAAPPQTDVDAIVDTLIRIILLIAIAGAMMYIESFILAGVAQKISYNMRRDIDEKINKMPLKYYDNITHGEVLSYMSNDVDSVATTLNQSLSQFVTSIVTIVGVLIMMFRISWIMTLIAIAIVPMSLILILLVVRFSQRFFVAQQKHLSDVNGHIEEMYGAHQVVELYGGKQESVKEFEVHNENLKKTAVKSQFLSGLMMPIMTFIGNLGYVAACVAGGLLTINGQITVGNIQAFIQYIRQFNQPLSQMGNIMNTLQLTVAAAERVFGFVDAEEEPETGDKTPATVSGDVEFKNVRFGYDPEKIIINDFSASVKTGDRVAIVGPTGAGKTTMIKLLMRFYDINDGQILLDGTDISEYTRASVRKNFGMVLQDTWLFNGTIMDNIRYGRLDATDEEVYAAAKAACAHHFIKTLEGGYNFVISEDADNISQGQKQLLTIARALLADPKVLILDEATSSVDTRTEKLIQTATDTLLEGRTSFIIAHRLSTVRDAKLILVMRDGDIVEQGSHDELMNMDGFYSYIYNSQFVQGAEI